MVTQFTLRTHETGRTLVSIEQSGVTTVDTMLVPALLVSVVANVVMGGQVYTCQRQTERQRQKGRGKNNFKEYQDKE